MQSPYGFSAFIQQLDAIGVTVVLVLIAMSVVSWYLIAVKATRTWQVRRRGESVVTRFWDAPSLDGAFQLLRGHHGYEPAAQLATDAISAAQHFQSHRQQAERIGDRSSVDDFITRVLRQTIIRETARLESGLTALASIGSTAPFVGLFGTVWGIYHALLGISTGGFTTLDKVAGPVAEALIMTAAGLAVAIPAVFAYNALTRANRLIIAEMDGFAHDLHTYLTTGAKLDINSTPGVTRIPARSALAAEARA
ncbi:MAG: MotA/TolQ/ExbB proton channel family protein [Betaproteobacteria bacterium]|nr:MotA/TolQ/ExbB proton channel family protein [Betaproteobacteria bacterium]